MAKIPRNLQWILMAVFLTIPITPAAHPQSAQQTGDPAKTDSSAPKSTKRPKKTVPAPQSATPAPTPPETPANAQATTPPAAKPSNPQPAPSAGVISTVWVNTESGIYHKPGSRYYGKTKRGKYMTEADARRAGYREAKKE